MGIHIDRCMIMQIDLQIIDHYAKMHQPVVGNQSRVKPHSDPLPFYLLRPHCSLLFASIVRYWSLCIYPSNHSLA